MPRHTPDALKRARRLARLVGALVGLLGGVFYGLWIISNSQGSLHNDRTIALVALLAAGAAGLASGALAGPLLSVEPFVWLERTLETAPAGELIGGTFGLLVGLVVSALVAVLLSGIPDGVGYLVALALAVAFVYIGVHTGMRRRVDIASVFSQAGRRGAAAAGANGGVIADDGPPPQDGPPVLVDTSVLIDGRILDIVATGFIPGRLVIPSFVLEELQRVADAGDSMRRARGRRGLAVVDGLKHSPDVVCEFLDTDIPGAADVDWRLIKLARQMGAAVMTNDFNLNKLARVEGLRVLNLNDLANALKPIVSAGEAMEVTIVKDGKEPHQGVGYLDDGTMVVVENGRRHIDSTVAVTVTSVLQTPAGRMIFAMVGSPDEAPPPPPRTATRPRPGTRATRVGNR
ncbi:MAG TPA: PIN domain-containing protein [Candidatus Dormibacteraeota bacterium]|nr:PIN domain-containing protein [Candidatus Dormibacteraeota bacterium]